jgi:hypothetical protein
MYLETKFSILQKKKHPFQVYFLEGASGPHFLEEWSILVRHYENPKSGQWRKENHYHPNNKH